MKILLMVFARLGQCAYNQVVERRGQGRSASVWYFGGKRLLAVDAMNDPRAYMVGKRIIEAGQTVQPNLVRDPTTDLRTLAPSAIGSSWHPL
ncbi:oxidoreductase C-terminal domain-containing protein [Gemmobacter caeni]|uniref:oxidoreductase C-terminal domain-containing protein n=1 Tax=Gemmobacter caeni TaxID=589035 RepID=UPI001F5500DD|nr:oxidoreductase C-terminal domain-containing protein [Gemmobacter caeni]